ncbi:hypothetical protein P7C73_g4292, partial [Tremellales sp. Uapishka_1]
MSASENDQTGQSLSGSSAPTAGETCKPPSRVTRFLNVDNVDEEEMLYSWAKESHFPIDSAVEKAWRDFASSRPSKESLHATYTNRIIETNSVPPLKQVVHEMTVNEFERNHPDETSLFSEVALTNDQFRETLEDHTVLATLIGGPPQSTVTYYGYLEDKGPK